MGWVRRGQSTHCVNIYSSIPTVNGSVERDTYDSVNVTKTSESRPSQGLRETLWHSVKPDSEDSVTLKTVGQSLIYFCLTSITQGIMDRKQGFVMSKLWTSRRFCVYNHQPRNHIRRKGRQLYQGIFFRSRSDSPTN